MKVDRVSKRHDSLSSNHAVLILLCAIIALATFLRLYHLGMESFSYDEGIMIDATGNDFEEVLVNIKRGRPPVLVIFGYLWVRIFGSTEAAVRGLSALAGILSVPLLFFLGRALFESRVGLLGALLLSVSLFHIYYSQDYRYYGLLALLTLFYIFFYVQLLNSAPPDCGSPEKRHTAPFKTEREQNSGGVYHIWDGDKRYFALLHSLSGGIYIRRSWIPFFVPMGMAHTKESAWNEKRYVPESRITQPCMDQQNSVFVDVEPTRHYCWSLSKPIQNMERLHGWCDDRKFSRLFGRNGHAGTTE